MRHERGLSLRIPCEACDAEGVICGGVLGPNDPEVIEFTCRECDGAGDVPAPQTDKDEEA